MISFDECLVGTFLAQEGSNLMVKLGASRAGKLLILSKVSPLIVSQTKTVTIINLEAKGLC